MNKARVLAAAAVVGVLAASSVSAGDSASHPRARDSEIMAPGRGVSLKIGGKHAVSYFETKDNTCQLTVVLADTNGGETGLDSPGTRIIVPVLAGRNFQIDAGSGRSAEFLCGPGASQMSARVYDRTPYKS